MDIAYQPPDEDEVFNTFHDMVHGAIVSNNGTATLKEIYAACIRFGRVKCRKTGGWRLVTERRNWKSHVRHTLYTTEKFLRCPHDSDLWMLAPEFCYTLPQTTRQLAPAPPDDNSEELPRGRSFRSRAKAAQPSQSAGNSNHQAGLRVRRPLAGKAAPAAQRPTGSRPQRAPPGVGSGDRRDSDSNDCGDDDLRWKKRQKIKHEDDELEQQEAGDEEQQQQPHRRRAPRCVGTGDAAAGAPWGDAAKAYGSGSRNGRAQALLGVTAAAAAASGDDELDLNDEETRTALHAAQEVLHNPHAARILLRLMEQQQRQQLKEGELHWQAAAMQEPARGFGDPNQQCTSPSSGDGDAAEDEGEEGEQGRACYGDWPLGGKADPARPRPGRGGPRRPVLQYPLSFGHSQPLSRGAPWVIHGSGIGGRGFGRDGCHRAQVPGGTAIGTAPHSSATGVAGHVGSAAAGAATGSRQMGAAGRLDALTSGEARGVGRNAVRAQAEAYAGAAWHEGDGTEGVSWQQPYVRDGNEDSDEDYDADEVSEAGRLRGATAGQPYEPGGARRRVRGGKVGRGVEVPPRSRPPPARLPPRHQLLESLPTAPRLSTASTTAAEAVAAVAVAATAGESPLRPAGHHQGGVLGKRSWMQGGDNGGFDGGPAGSEEGEKGMQEECFHPQYLPQQLHYHNGCPRPQMLRRLADELQSYHSHSLAAAAAADVQQSRGYPGRILC